MHTNIILTIERSRLLVFKRSSWRSTTRPKHVDYSIASPIRKFSGTLLQKKLHTNVTSNSNLTDWNLNGLDDKICCYTSTTSSMQEII